MAVHAEISIIPITGGLDTGMSKEVAAAYDAIRGVRGIKATLTALGTQIEAEEFDDVLKALKAAHAAVKNAGAKRVISSIRIDERLDKSQTLQDKIESVERKLKDRKYASGRRY